MARADVLADIRTILQDKYLSRAELSISIVRVGDKREATTDIFKHDSDIPLAPASNLKLLTTSAFLDRVGPDFKFRTVLLMKGQDLYLIGDGDPAFGDGEVLRKSGWDVTTVYKLWCDQLKKLEVQRVENVFVDDSVFDMEFIPVSWAHRYMSAQYSAQVGGMNLNVNCVDFFVRPTTPGQLAGFTTQPPGTKYVTVKHTCMTGAEHAVAIGRVPGKNEIVLSGSCKLDGAEPIPVTVNDPAMFAATTLAETLAANGIAVGGKVARERTAREKFAKDPTGWSVVAALETPLAPTILARCNKDSMNLYAEALCKRLGNAATNEPGSWASGTAAVGEFMKKAGVEPSQHKLVDGCGLSRDNAVSAGAITTVLTYDFFAPQAQVFRDSLGVAGVDGTLKSRFKNSDLRERVFAKSGYIDGVSALSGYLRAKDGRWYAFSILMNRLPDGTNNTAKAIQERIISAVDRAGSGPAAASVGAAPAAFEQR